MPKRLFIPPELLPLNPNLQIKEIRAVIQTILHCRANILRNSSVVDFKIPGIGRIKSHGNKKKNLSHVLLKDRKRKRVLKRKKELEPHNLLF